MSAMGGKLTLTQVTFSDSFSAPMAALRYILYLALAFSALAFWPLWRSDSWVSRSATLHAALNLEAAQSFRQ